MLSKSKRMRNPVEVAVAIKKGPKKPLPPAHSGSDDDEEDDDDQFGPNDDEDSGMHSLYGDDDSDGVSGHDDDPDGDGIPDDEDPDDAGDGAPVHLTPHEMEHTSLADATPEQLQAALSMKKPPDHNGDDEGEGESSPQGGSDADDEQDGEYL